MKGFRRAKAHGGYFFIVERSEAIKMDTGNPLIGFPHVPTFHWNVVTPFPDHWEDFIMPTAPKGGTRGKTARFPPVRRTAREAGLHFWSGAKNACAKAPLPDLWGLL